MLDAKIQVRVPGGEQCDDCRFLHSTKVPSYDRSFKKEKDIVFYNCGLFGTDIGEKRKCIACLICCELTETVNLYSDETLTALRQELCERYEAGERSLRFVDDLLREKSSRNGDGKENNGKERLH